MILLNRSTQTSDRASQAFNAAETVFQQDVQLFTQFAIGAQRKSDENITAYIKESLMRPELKKQVEWWAETPDDVETPFVKQDPFYVPPSQNKTEVQLREKAAAEFKRARTLDDAGDEYVLYTVLFAASLFLYGIASVASSRKVLYASMGTGAVLFVFAAILMIGTTADAPKLL